MRTEEQPASRKALRLSLVLLVIGVFCVPRPGVAQDGTGSDHPRVAPELLSLAEQPENEPVSVWIVFREQPAVRIAERLRDEYRSRFETARLPALAALERIEPLLPPRDERRRLSVSSQMALEKSLLFSTEIEALTIARDETVRLVLEMRHRTLETARPECAAIQAPVENFIEALDGGAVNGHSDVLNSVFAFVRPRDASRLADTYPSIAWIAKDPKLSLTMDKSVPTLGAGSWTTNAYNGSGQKVCVLDSGIDSTHPAFSITGGGNVVAAATVKLSVGSTYANFADNASSTDDLHGHGTHVGGTVASQDSTYGGVAPGAALLNGKCFYKTSSSASADGTDIAQATDWGLTQGATVFNGSFGASLTSDGQNVLSKYFDAVVLVGGASVAISAGNSGSSSGTILVPGDGFNVFTVGAFDDKNSTSLSDDALASFSSRGNTADGRLKPDLSAPGVSIRSTAYNWEGSSADFVNKSGTSMAAPHVAGAMALLLDYTSSWQPEAVKALLLNSVRNSSPAPTTPDANWGHGGMSLGAAYSDRTMVETGTLNSTGDDFALFTMSSVTSGDRSTVAWNRSAAFGTNRAVLSATSKSLVNLDLFLFDGDDGSQDTSSERTKDSVEQLKSTSSITNAVLKIKRSAAFPTGQTTVDWGLASERAMTAVDGPELVLTLDSAPSFVAGGDEATITVELDNDGDLDAFAPLVTLALPTGWTFATGSTAAVTLGDLDGTTRSATWTVVVPDDVATGTTTLTVAAESTSYKEKFEAPDLDVDLETDGTPPTADAGDDISEDATSPDGRTIQLDGTASTDDSGLPIIGYEWDTDGDGSFSDPGGRAFGATPSVLFPIGITNVTLRVQDHAGNLGTDTLIVEVIDTVPVADVGDDVDADEGSSVAFDGTGSTDIEGALAYAWDFGDGSLATGATPNHTYIDEGLYTVTLVVTDLAGQTDTDTALVTVSNVAPTADAGTVGIAVEGVSVSFAGSATDPGDDAITYSWDFGDGATASGASPSHTYADNGDYTATLTATDDVGATGTDSIVVAVANAIPSPEAGDDASSDEGSNVAFSGSATDVAADTLTFAWDFGDGSTATGQSPSHAFADNGTYIVTLRVTDDDGGTATDTLTVTVANVAPVPNAGAPLSGDEGTGILFIGSASDAGSDTLTYRWDFGDGRAATTATPSYAYRQNGVYTATFTVTDDDGASASSSISVTISNVAPTANAGADATGDEGSPVAFAASATDPGSLDVLTYAWTFGDGGTGTGRAPSYTYDQDGTFTATVTVSDADGGSHADALTVTVANVLPSLTLPSGLSVDVGDPMTLALSPTDASNADAGSLTVTWRVLDGETSVYEGSGLDFLWPADRLLTGELEVTVGDDDGQTVRTTAIKAVLPSIDSALGDVLGPFGEFDPRVEKKLLGLIGKAYDAIETRSATKRKTASKTIAKTLKTLERAGVTDGPLVWRLTVLGTALAVGRTLPMPLEFEPPADPGTLTELIAAVPSAVVELRTRKRLSKALAALRFDTRRGKSEKQLAKLRKKALRFVEKLPADDTADWFRASLAALSS